MEVLVDFPFYGLKKILQMVVSSNLCIALGLALFVICSLVFFWFVF